MVVTPTPTPKAKPEVLPIVAAAVLLLIHDPVPVASVKVVVAPRQILVAPEIAAGEALTVII